MSDPVFLYPQVPAIKKLDESATPVTPVDKEAFTKALGDAMSESARGTDQAIPGGALPGIRFSKHASERLVTRGIRLSSEELSHVRQAVDMVAAKGVEDGLILTSKAAFIVNVPSRTIVTALDRNHMEGNVFTHIDGAVVLN